MKAVFLTNSFAHGGAERHAISVMNGLARRGHACHALYVKPQADLVERIQLQEGAVVNTLGASRYLDRRALWACAGRLAELAPDVVVAANPYALLYATLAARRARVRIARVVTYHTTELRGWKERLQMVYYRPFFWAAHRAIFVSERQKSYWMRRGVFARSNEVIHNGVDTEHYRERASTAERRRLRAGLGFNDADFVIGISAVLRPEKNHLQFVDAVAALRARGVPARGVIIGDGAMRRAVEARVRARGIDRDIVLAGLQADVRPYLAACDAMVLCSTAVETFSLAALEAMALGKPVVHSDLGGASEMIHPGYNGYIFPPGDTRALVERLAALAAPAVAAEMGRNARSVVEARFSLQRMIDRYEATLLEVCGRHARQEGYGAVRME